MTLVSATQSSALTSTLLVLAAVGVGCQSTPSTPAVLCIRDFDTKQGVQDAKVQLSEVGMFQLRKAHDEGITGIDGCVRINAGLLAQMAVIVNSEDGTYYIGRMSHPRLSQSASVITLSPYNAREGPTLEIGLTEVK